MVGAAGLPVGHKIALVPIRAVAPPAFYIGAVSSS